MQASEVKQGDAVVFQVQDTEYNGIALSDAKVSVHPGGKRAAIYLDLVYLNEGGVAVKVLSAAALVGALAADDVEKIVAAEIAARRHDPRKSTLAEFGGDTDAASLRQELLETKQVSGWKVMAGCRACGTLTEELLLAVKRYEALQAKYDALLAQTTASDPEREQPAADQDS